jgi:YVTN family beta-propeller protein
MDLLAMPPRYVVKIALSLSAFVASLSALGVLAACGGAGAAPGPDQGNADAEDSSRFPLQLVADVPLPGRANRFDYQDIDQPHGHLVIAHMNDASVVVVNLSDGAVQRVLPNIPTARGVVVASDVGRIFVTSSPNQVVVIDSNTLSEITRVTTGTAPDGIGWDPADKIVGVSDQQDGAISLLHDSGTGQRVQVPLGSETGNVLYDAARATFWITVVSGSSNKLMAVDPLQARVTTRIDLPGCEGAHGLRLHPDGQSALVACEDNSMVARVDLGGAHAVTTAATGSGPDVLSIDPGLGLLYIAAESGDLAVFDLTQPGLRAVDREHPGDASHSVAVDPSTHHVFFPLLAGPHGTPVLRIMRPLGS